MTIACLLSNTLEAAMRRRGIGEIASSGGKSSVVTAVVRCQERRYRTRENYAEGDCILGKVIYMICEGI